MTGSPGLIVLESKVILSLLSLDGKKALYSVTNRAKVVSQLKERYIKYASDGQVEIRIISPGKIVEEIQLIGGCIARIEYDPPLEPNSILDMRLECLFNNSFTQPNEYFVLTIEYPIEQLYYEINFPPGSEVIESSVSLISGGQAKQDIPPNITQDQSGNYRIFGERKNLPMGSEYKIDWFWHPKDDSDMHDSKLQTPE